MDLNQYMEQGIQVITRTAAKFYLNNKPGIRFLAGLLPALKKSGELRKRKEASGLHVPPFLIASITSSCNLHCSGCYARADGMCCDSEETETNMLASEWETVFSQASQLGVSFILLAGGEPLLRPDVIEAAAAHKNMVFPVFTNGLLLQGSCLELFNENRNLIPVISAEGSGQRTDRRRGAGVAKQIEQRMANLKERGILFAVSITVTSENVHEVTDAKYLLELREKGCGVIFYIEYVPAETGTEELVLSSAQLSWLTEQTLRLKKRYQDMTILSFPGDEQFMGGCLAAGRGFFHISPSGCAEPCPFSPFSKMNVKRESLETILASAFFRQVREIEQCAQDHHGGCTLFLHEQKVKNLL